MTEEQINEIQSLFYSGMTKADIARKMDCPIIVYKGVYDFLQEHQELSLYAFCQLVFNKAELYDQNRIRPLQDFLQGKHKGHFSLDVFQAICKVVGETFEDTFSLR